MAPFVESVENHGGIDQNFVEALERRNNGRVWTLHRGRTLGGSGRSAFRSRGGGDRSSGRGEGGRRRGGDDGLKIGPLLQGDLEAFLLHLEDGEVILPHQSDEFFDFF